MSGGVIPVNMFVWLVIIPWVHKSTTEYEPCMSVLLLDRRSLIFAGRCSGPSTSSPLSTSQEVTDACDRLPWDECVLPTDLLLNTNLGKQSAFKVTCDEFTSKKDFFFPKTQHQIVVHHDNSGFCFLASSLFREHANSKMLFVYKEEAQWKLSEMQALKA